LNGQVVRTTVADRAALNRVGLGSSSQQAGTLVRGVLDVSADVTTLTASPVHGDAVVVLGSPSILELFRRQASGTVGEGDGS
jgi:hypothetical protein